MVLNTGPILAPDVVIGHFVDFNTVNLHESISEELGSSWLEKSTSGSGNGSGSSETESESKNISSSQAIRKVSEREELGKSFSRFGRIGIGTATSFPSPDVSDEEDSDFTHNETEDEVDVEELSLPKNAPLHSCFIK